VKHAVVTAPDTTVADSVVRRAIDCLDSSTDYREGLPSQQWIRPSYSRRRHKRSDDIEEFLLVYMPILLVGIAILAIVYN